MWFYVFQFYELLKVLYESLMYHKLPIKIQAAAIYTHRGKELHFLIGATSQL